MEFRPSLPVRARAFLRAAGYVNPSYHARGKSGGVWRVMKNGKSFAVKVEHSKSTRVRMLEKEARHLAMANEVGVGPKVVEYDKEAGLLVMGFVEGTPLGDWIRECNDKRRMEKMLEALFAQANHLDAAGIDHGQLGGKLHNVLVDKRGNPVILDFEKASYVRRVHNASKLREVLLGNRTPFSKKIRSLLGADL